eukprot:TRINITY_DN2209_c0_g1_i2.p1 TRINITY_DN2209_c0_g1~~TRINITY_DN2209_c0_g1_i2.p1  ORF type:complete len:280 (+),score=32.20 TRINITY_DN2209_c0_g1_i2:45-842(+)
MEMTHQQSNEENSKVFQCETCLKSFSKRRYLTKHVKIHTGEHSCRYCFKPFSDKYYLRKHEMIHTRHKNITSDTETQHLTQHDKINKPATVNFCENNKFQTKPYLCIHCFTPFEMRSVLNDHKMTVHGIDDSTSIVNFTSKVTQPASQTIEVPIVTDIDQLRSANNLLLIAEHNVDFGLTYPMVPLVLGSSTHKQEQHQMNNNLAPQTSQYSPTKAGEHGLKNGNSVCGPSSGGGAHGNQSMLKMKDDATKNIVYNYGNTSSFFN